jgi:hypothetical protein
MLAALPAYAQQNFSEYEFSESLTYVITLKDGSELIGKFISKTTTTLKLSTLSLPSVEIPFETIKKIEVADLDNIRSDGSYWFPNPNPTRYLFGSSAINLKPRTGYYQNSYLFVNSVNVGITDYFSFGGGFELISTFSPGVPPIWFVTPKVGTQIFDKVHIGAGTLFGIVDGTSFGIGYGIATYGNEDNNITAGLGWGFTDEETANKPIITVSGMKRTHRHVSFISENWFIPFDEEYYGVISYGVRFFGSNIAVDLAFLNNADIAEIITIGIPYVDFVVSF